MRLKLFFSIVAAAAMIMTGCNKQTELEINYGKTATLKGKVVLFEPNGATSKIGSEVKVFAKADYSSLVSGSQGLSGIKTFETITDSEGNFEFVLPVKEEANGTTTGTTYNLTAETKVIDNNYYVFDGSQSVDLNVGDLEYKVISMILTTPAEAKYIIKGKVVTQNSLGTGTIPVSNCEIKTNGTTVYTTKTDINGEYTLELPSSTDIDNITIHASFKNEDETTLTGSINGRGNYTVEGNTYTFEDIEI